MSDPAPGSQHDMAKLGSDVGTILKKAGGVRGDKGFIGNRLHHDSYPQAEVPAAVRMGA